MKNNKGITLIALIITIIVLCILAGVSIKLITEKEGLVEKGQQGASEFDKAAALELMQIKAKEGQMKYYSEINNNEGQNKTLLQSIADYLTEDKDVEFVELGELIASIDVTGYSSIYVKLKAYVYIFEVKDNGEIMFVETNTGDVELENNSLIGEISKIQESGYYNITVNNVEYNLHIIVYKGNLVLDGETSLDMEHIKLDTDKKIYEFGDSETDVGCQANSYVAQSAVVFKVNGNLTINENVIVSPCKSSAGYGGPKGFFVYCTKTLTNNGEIQNNYGARAAGEDVYLWYNKSKENYEFIPATGANGGTAVTSKSGGTYGTGVTGSVGKNANTISVLSGSGVTRATAGGAGGGTAASTAYSNQSGAKGGNGTSYSGGGGGGGTARNAPSKVATPYHASLSIGGQGSIVEHSGYGELCSAGGGAGCKPGNGRKSTKGTSYQNGSVGTGGLLIIYANNLEINSSTLFSAMGAKGGNAVAGSTSNWTGSAAAGGGGSGGGSINIFAQKIIDNTDNNIASCINVNGGTGGRASGGKRNGNGGAGGTGSCNIGIIKSGDYETFYSNY